jgi:DNA-binding winged helix-turn-helix (wHTH) protein
MSILRFLTAGESHGPKLTTILEGMVAGLPLESEAINRELFRRQQSYGSGGRMRIEKDEAHITAGVMAVLRRWAGDREEKGGRLLRAGDIELDRERHEVRVGGRVVEMPLMEYRLLELFLRHPGKALPREYLISQVWEGDYFGQSKTLEVHIRRLREKIEPDPSRPSRVVTVRGVGYRFEAGGDRS